MEKITAIDSDGLEWSWVTEEEQDGDGFWANEHYALGPNGERRHLDWSRFANYTTDNFKTYIAAGMPRRTGIGPWSPLEIQRLKAA